MNWPLIVVIGTQILFSTSDLLARTNMPKNGFSFESFFSWWFLTYFLIRNVAMFGQLYVFTTIELGKTMALFGAVSIVLANVLGFLFLKEVFSPSVYIGISLAIIAYLVIALF